MRALYFHWMMNIDLKGRWAGEYIYGPTYGPELEGRKGDFIMYIQDIKESSFEGKVIETDGDGEFHEAVLKGFIQDYFISFTKTFDKYRFYDENLDIKEAEGDGSGYYVVYEGSFDHDLKQFNGQWEISFDVTPLATEEIIEEFWEGTWWMKKVE